MHFLADAHKAPDFDFNRPVPVEAVEAEYDGRREPTLGALGSFAWDQSVIPLEGGFQLLKLQKPLQLQTYREKMRFTVADWGIELDCFQLPQLPREVARRFLFLLRAAEDERLTEQEQADWLRISDYVDFQQFSIDRATPRYMEGSLRTRDGTVIVDWHDGSHETLENTAARALSEVNPGERFSAFVKLGRGDKTLTIERVSLLGCSAQNEEWESWPRKS
jgi:hypothetical protein